MSAERTFPVELQRLLDQLVDGTISEQGRTQIDEALRQQPELLDYFLDYCQLHIDLAIDLRADQALESFRQRQQQIAAPVGMTESPLGALDAGSPSIAEQRFFGFTGFFALGIAVCMLMLVAVVGLWWWTGEYTARDRAPLPIAQLTPASPQVKSIKINSGSSTLDLAGIGSVVVEGPADFELTGEKRARLNRGKIRVHVNQESGRGFVVETPDGEVTDLGTEFGLDVADHPGTGLVVFQGSVDLRVGEAEQISDNSPAKRFVGGEGVRFTKAGKLNRIMSIITGPDGLFQLLPGSAQSPTSIITNVSDNIRAGDLNMYYEIVAGGLKEGAQAYVDRHGYEWRSFRGAWPKMLDNADYVKPFNGDKVRKNLKLELSINRPARLFVIWDDRIKPTPKWFTDLKFHRNGDRVVLRDVKQVSKSTNDTKAGSANEPEYLFSLWELDVEKPSTIELGATGATSGLSAMYGIAAVELDKVSKPKVATEKQ